MIARLKRLLHGGRWAGITDQMLVSSVALLQIVLYSRLLPRDEFGYFSLVIGIALLCQGIQRGAFIIPVIVLFPTREAYAGSGRWQIWHFTFVGVVGVFLATGGMLAQMVGLESLGRILLLSAPVATSAMLYDYQRRGLYSMQKEKAAVFSSLCLLSVIIIATSLVWSSGLATATAAVMVISAAQISAMVVALFLKGPLGTRSTVQRKTHAEIRHVVVWNLLSFLPYSVYNNGMVLIVGTVGGPVSAAVFAATRTFLSPIQMLISAIDTTDKPRASRAMAEGGPRALAQSLRGTTATLIVLSLPYLLSVLVFPELIGRVLLGSDFAADLWLAQIWAVIAFFMMIGQPLETGLITQGKSHLLFFYRMLVAGICVLLVMVMVPPLGAAGAVFSLMASWIMASLIGGVLLMRSLR